METPFIITLLVYQAEREMLHERANEKRDDFRYHVCCICCSLWVLCRRRDTVGERYRSSDRRVYFLGLHYSTDSETERKKEE